MDLMWRDVVVFAAIIGLAALLNWLTSPSHKRRQQHIQPKIVKLAIGGWPYLLIATAAIALISFNVIVLWPDTPTTAPTSTQLTAVIGFINTIIGASLAGALALWRSRIANKREKNERQKLELDEFAKAVAMLDEKNALSVRQSAVIMLQGVAIRSPNHTQHCIDILCGLNGWMAEQLEQDNTFFGNNWLNRQIRLDDSDIRRAAVKEQSVEEAAIEDTTLAAIKARREEQVLSQTVLKSLRAILSAVSSNRDKYLLPLSMAGKYLCGIDLSELTLHNSIDFAGAKLHYAEIRTAQLQGVNLYRAQLQNADLYKAQLQGADLFQVQSQGASLWATQLQGATLIQAQLQGATLWETQLQGVDATFAQLQGTFLLGVSFQGANLEKVQMHGAINSSLSFPEHIGQFAEFDGIDDNALDDDTIARVIAAVQPYVDNERLEDISARLHNAKGKVFVLPKNVEIGILTIAMAEKIRRGYWPLTWLKAEPWDWFAPIAYRYKNIEDFYIKQCGQEQWDEYQQQLRTNSE